MIQHKHKSTHVVANTVLQTSVSTTRMCEVLHQLLVPNHDVKYDVNKLRSQAHAARHNVGIVYSVAKDTPCSEALRAQPDLPIRKLSWLQRHDRESGDLYSILL